MTWVQVIDLGGTLGNIDEGGVKVTEEGNTPVKGALMNKLLTTEGFMSQEIL